MSALKAEIADAVREAQEPIMRQLERLQRDMSILREGDQAEWWSVSKVAEYLGVHEDTVRKRAREGHWDTQRPGKKIMIRRSYVITP